MSTITAYGPYVLPAGQSLVSADSAALILTYQVAANSTVTIGGDILMPGPGPDTMGATSPSAIVMETSSTAGGVLHIAATAHIDVRAWSPKATAVGVMDSTWGPQFVNDGSIKVSGPYYAYGVLLGARTDDASPDFINRGTITVTSDTVANGVLMNSGGDVVNSGTLSVSGREATVGLSVNFQNGVRGAPTTLDNSGVIQAFATTAHDGVAVTITSNIGGAIVNSGTLQGDTALRLTGVGFGLEPWEVKNTGRMIGQVRLSDSADHLVNSGSVTGDVDLGGDNDTYDGRLGSVTGMVAGGDGADTLMGGAGFDYLQGNAGADSESGGAGDDWVVGGQGNDQLFGGDGNDIVYANLGDDTLSGDAGADWVRGGQGNDVLSGGAGNDFMSGDKGDDTISGGAGADIFHSFGDAGADRVTDFSATEGDRVQLDPGTAYRLSQSGADTVITMTGGAVMTLVGVKLSSLPEGWIFVG